MKQSPKSQIYEDPRLSFLTEMGLWTPTIVIYFTKVELYTVICSTFVFELVELSRSARQDEAEKLKHECLIGNFL